MPEDAEACSLRGITPATRKREKSKTAWRSPLELYLNCHVALLSIVCTELLPFSTWFKVLKSTPDYESFLYYFIL